MYKLHYQIRVLLFDIVEVTVIGIVYLRAHSDCVAWSCGPLLSTPPHLHHWGGDDSKVPQLHATQSEPLDYNWHQIWPLTVSHYELQIQRIGRHWMYPAYLKWMKPWFQGSQRINLALDVCSLQLTFLFFTYRSRCVLTGKLIWFLLELCKRGKLPPPFKTSWKTTALYFISFIVNFNDL